MHIVLDQYMLNIVREEVLVRKYSKRWMNEDDTGPSLFICLFIDCYFREGETYFLPTWSISCMKHENIRMRVSSRMTVSDDYYRHIDRYRRNGKNNVSIEHFPTLWGIKGCVCNCFDDRFTVFVFFSEYIILGMGKIPFIHLLIKSLWVTFAAVS
jgi:hypothetical protein